jgi:hypothetical protein
MDIYIKKSDIEKIYTEQLEELKNKKNYSESTEEKYFLIGQEIILMHFYSQILNLEIKEFTNQIMKQINGESNG